MRPTNIANKISKMRFRLDYKKKTRKISVLNVYVTRLFKVFGLESFGHCPKFVQRVLFARLFKTISVRGLFTNLEKLNFFVYRH